MMSLWIGASAGLRRKACSSPRKARPAVAAPQKLLAKGFLKASEKIVIYNTGAGLKYLEAYSTRFPRVNFESTAASFITPR